MLKKMLILSLLLFSSVAWPSLITSTATTIDTPVWTGSFLLPNELNPIVLTPLLSAAPSGIYITVGTERAFFGVSLASNVDHLLVIDLDPQVILYNQLFESMLMASENRGQLFQLKQAHTFLFWKKARHKLRSTGFQKNAELFSKENFIWYKNLLKQNPSDRPKKTTISPDIKSILDTKDYILELGSANYLENEQSFLKLRNMALDRRMQFVQGNLGDLNFMEEVVEELHRKTLKISVIDLSNMHLSKAYIKDSELAKLLFLLRKISRSNTVLVGSLSQLSSYVSISNWVNRLQSLEDISKLLHVFKVISDMESDLQLEPNSESSLENSTLLKKFYEELSIKPIRFSPFSNYILEFQDSPISCNSLFSSI